MRPVNILIGWHSHLTLTSVVFESAISLYRWCIYKNLTLTSVVFEYITVTTI